LKKLILTCIGYFGEFPNLIGPPAVDDDPHHWEGEWISLQDRLKGPPPDNGLEVMYHAATLGDRMLGHGEPIRVREGERVLFRLLNTSANMGISLALPGHRFNVVALDGNPVPSPATVDVLKLDVAERADVIVEMNNPGVWVFGSADNDDRMMGMGIVIEYANRRGDPQWVTPPKVVWDYTTFGRREPFPMRRSTSNSRKFLAGGEAITAGPSMASPGRTPIPCLRFRRASGIASLWIITVATTILSICIGTASKSLRSGDKATSGVMKDTISFPRYSGAEIDFVADDPGPTFFHCHHQDHMDECFAGLISYA
jgi:FtsP/CotA-like multicopper oxidase with cupredoxin domain